MDLRLVLVGLHGFGLGPVGLHAKSVSSQLLVLAFCWSKLRQRCGVRGNF